MPRFVQLGMRTAMTQSVGRFSGSQNSIYRFAHSLSQRGPLHRSTALVAGTGLAAFFLHQFIQMQNNSNSPAKACGIMGFISHKDLACEYLLEGLTILQNRGYDSAGIATISSDSELITSKFASISSTSDSLEILQRDAPSMHEDSCVGIAHTRWATHGGKTTENAHPHCDYKNRIAIIHNGTIENFHEIKTELIELGIPFKSETDTEAIAQLIGHYLDQDLPILDAVKKTLTRLEGTWGLAVIAKDAPDQIIAARNGSPLVVGIGQNKMFLASETSAFSRHTTNYIALNDGELAVIKAEGASLDLSRIKQAPDEKIELSPKPYPHWTIKEIMEQPQAIGRTLGYGGRFDTNGKVKLGGLDTNREVLMQIKHLLLTGCGTSKFASNYGAKLMRSLKCFDTVQVQDAAEVTSDNIPLSGGGLCCVSQSGETKDTHRSLLTAVSASIPRFSIVNQVGSLIARSTNCGVYLNAGREHAVASTKAFTTQVTALALVAAWFAQNRELAVQHSQQRKVLLDAIHRLPIYAGITLKSHDKCKEIAEKLKNKDHIFLLGKGFAEPIAQEGALKLKELTYVHAEGYSGGALKHGPFALLEEGTPIIMFILDDQHADLMRIAAAEVHARGSYNIIITDNPKLAEGIADDVITIPSNGPLTALLGTLPIQMIAYEMALGKGINPDKPRNLAKAVTVD